MFFETNRPGGLPPLPFDYRGQQPDPIVPLLRWVLIFGVLLAIYIIFSIGRGIYTEWLWFENVGFQRVYATVLVTKVWLFFAGALLFAAFFVANIYLSIRLSRRAGLPMLPEEFLGMVRRAVNIVFILASIFLSLIFGAVAMGQWDNILRFANAVPFGQADPAFGKDASFYVFTLPFYRSIQRWLMGAVVVTLLGGLGIYIVNFGLRGFNFAFNRPIRVHIFLLGAAALLLISWSYWFDIYELVFSSRGAVFGATFTDVNAQLTAYRILIVIASFCALLLIASVFTGGIRLPLWGVGIWVAASIVVGNIYPGLVQQFDVVPNELARETPYIQNNVKATRYAFGLDSVEAKSFPAEGQVKEEDILKNPDTIDNVRLWDYRPLKDTYNQIQFIRLYYDFHDVDVDRYTIDDRYRQVMVGPRELSVEKLPAEAQRWINQKLQFTHGYGVAMSPVTEFSPEGRPLFFIKDVPPAGDIPLERPQIYFGEKTTSYVIVNTNIPEFDYPTKEDIPVYTKYQGKGGVLLSSYIRRLAYALQFGDVNILIAGGITPESRIQYFRHIQERVNHVAPFLRLDGDPYMVVADGKLFWIQDAYTTTSRYPYSQPFEGGINYIRNSVKVVIDAYEGTMDFYIADPDDALVRTYQNIFPTLFKPIDDMPASLRVHVRYPEDLFMVQARMLLKYHMQDAKVFYNREDLWDIPQELYYGKYQQMEPYYVIMRLLGEPREEFLLLLPFTPANKPNMVGWLAARSDGENYGKLLLYNFPKDKQIDGPSQIEARINNDPVIAQQLTLWDQRGSRVIRGNLLVIPIENSLLYVEPIFLQAEQLAFPELKRVVVVTSDRVTMQPTLAESLAAVTGGRVSPPAVTPPGGEQPPGGTPRVGEEIKGIQDALKNVQEELKKLEEALNNLLESLR
ncbi:MAG: UPF0182 family protein [Chloroflexi bacterium]|nr:UPF0182 family protein [Chloroflexota bacterium]